MTFQLTTSQALKSFAAAAISGLSLDATSLVSRHMSDAVWFALREVVALLFWGVLSCWQASHAQAFGHGLFLVGCPLDLLGSLVHLLGSAL